MKLEWTAHHQHISEHSCLSFPLFPWIWIEQVGKGGYDLQQTSPVLICQLAQIFQTLWSAGAVHYSCHSLFPLTELSIRKKRRQAAVGVLSLWAPVYCERSVLMGMSAWTIAGATAFVQLQSLWAKHHHNYLSSLFPTAQFSREGDGEANSRDSSAPALQSWKEKGICNWPW